MSSTRASPPASSKTAAVRAALAQALAGGGAEVIVASDGADGIAGRGRRRPRRRARRFRQPDSGVEAFVAAVRSDPRFADVPVITMSAEGGSRRGCEELPLFDVDDVLAIVLSLASPTAAPERANALADAAAASTERARSRCGRETLVGRDAPLRECPSGAVLTAFHRRVNPR